MRSTWSGIILAALLLAPHAARAGPGLASEKEKVSYALGMDLGNKLRKMPLDVDPAVAGKGLEDALAGRKTLLTEEEARTVLATMQSELKARQGAMLSTQAGEAYLADNARKPGVVVLASGLQYKVRWHVISNTNANRNPQIRLRARSIKFMWSQKQEYGGALAAGNANNAIAQQVLPGIGCQNPDQLNPGESGGWYTLWLHTPLSSDILASQPTIEAQPGPGGAGSSTRDIK